MRRALPYALVTIVAVFLVIAFLLLAFGEGWLDLAKAIASTVIAAAIAMYGFHKNIIPV